jgi:hypothetical protein
MKIRFDKTGTERKALAAALSEITGCEARFMYAPTFSYRVGDHTITRDGALETDCTENITAVLAGLEERGFVPAEKPELPGESAADDAPDAMIIEIPDNDFTDLAFDNLARLVAGKAGLIRHAIGEHLTTDAGSLPITRDDGKICFPWFCFNMKPEEVTAWSRFTGALCALAKRQKRVSISDKPYDGSEKYGMRCFLLKLGFIGEEYKDARKIILARLTGNGSHKKPKDVAQAVGAQ